ERAQRGRLRPGTSKFRTPLLAPTVIRRQLQNATSRRNAVPRAVSAGSAEHFRARYVITTTGAAHQAQPRRQPYINPLLLQRVLQSLGRCKIRRVIHSRGIRTTSLRKRKVFDPPSMEQTGKALIAFDAARLVTLSGEFLLDGPGPGPH